MPDRLERLAAKLADLRAHGAALLTGAPALELAPPLTADELAAAEAGFGARLPDAYRGFLTRIGASGAGPDYGLNGPAQWAMPAEFVQVTSTVTTTSGEAFSAGTGPRPALAGAPAPTRPFRVPAGWRPVDDDGDLAAAPVPPDAHPYDGCLYLGEIGCGYFNFLVVAGPHAGEVWCDYTAGDGAIAPLAPFLDWYEEWVDAWLLALVDRAVSDALDAGAPDAGAPSGYDALIRRWADVVHDHAASHGPLDAALRLYLGDRAAALACAAALDADPAVRAAALDPLDRWLHRDASAAAAARPPDAAAALAAPSWRVRRALAANPDAPADALARLVADDRAEVRLAALRHPRCPADALDAAATAAEARWDGAAPPLELDLLARHPGAPAATLARLGDLPARRPAHPLASAVVRAAALNPRCPPALLVRFSDSPWPWVRHAVAGHAAAPAPTVARLAADPHWAVRAAIARRPDADAHLAALAADPVAEVRHAVAANPRAPAALLRRLAAGGDHRLAYALAGNAALPDDALEIVAAHPSEPVRDGARPAPAPPPPELPLADLIHDRGHAGHPALPPALLDAAIAHADVMWGYGAAQSPWLDAAQREALARHPYAYARNLAVAHPDASPELRARVAREDAQPMTVRAASLTVALDELTLARLAADADHELRWAAADNAGASPALLARLAADPHAYVRRACAGNPRTPLDVAVALSRDADAGVRATAAGRLDLPAARTAELEADASPAVARAARWTRLRRALASDADTAGAPAPAPAAPAIS